MWSVTRSRWTGSAPIRHGERAAAKVARGEDFHIRRQLASDKWRWKDVTSLALVMH